MREQQLKQALHELAANEVPVSLNLWPAIRPRLRPQRQLQSPFRQGRISRVAWAGIAMVLMFGIMLAVSPGALAQVGDAIRKIGSMTFFERERFPDDLGAKGTAANQRSMSLAEAQAQVPFTIKLPSWFPMGYAANDEVLVATAPTGCSGNCSLWIFSVIWRKPLTSSEPMSEYAANWFSLEIAHPAGVAQRVKSGSVEQMLINGKPAALVHGIWDKPTQQWVTGNMTNLMWTENTTLYELRAGKGVSLDDLIHMAETIR